MINYKKAKSLFLKIYDNKSLCQKVEDYIKKNESKISFCLKFCRKRKWQLFLKKDPFFKLCLVYAYLPEVKEKYEKLNIDDKIFFDTMDDIRIWIIDHKERTGKDGLYELNWILLHMNLDIFKLGRLQFQKCTYYFGASYKKDSKEIKFGEKVLNLHIPRGEKLLVEDCEESIKLAKEFFKVYFPEYRTDLFICHSWLLSPLNKNFMKKDSNILKFASLFDVIKSKEEPTQTFLWLFGIKTKEKDLFKSKNKTGTYCDTSKLCANTPLQKSAIKYINGGGTFGEGMGILIR